MLYKLLILALSFLTIFETNGQAPTKLILTNEKKEYIWKQVAEIDTTIEHGGYGDLAGSVACGDNGSYANYTRNGISIKSSTTTYSEKGLIFIETYYLNNLLRAHKLQIFYNKGDVEIEYIANVIEEGKNREIETEKGNRNDLSRPIKKKVNRILGSKVF